MKSPKFSHKTPHLKGKQHQLDPNLDLKQLVHHATVQYVDRDADGDVDIYDNPKKGIPDENVSSASKAQTYSKKLIAKQKGEIKHTKVGMAYEEKKNGKCEPGKYYCYTDKKCKPIPAGFMVDPEGMLHKENGASVDESARIPRKPGQPAKSDNHSDLYTDEDPKGTIHGLGFKDVETARKSVSKIKNSDRSHAHKIQAAIAMEQRARVAGKTSEAAIYREFINSMKEKTKEMSEEGLRDWFGKSKSKEGKSGWVNVVTGGTCASDEPGEGVPKCVSSAKRASMTPAERRSAARRKKAADPRQQQKTGAAKPTYVSTDKPKKKMKEEMDVQEAKDKPGKGSGTKDACYHKVKSRYKVWPSAYASGALVKCRKVGADNWGTKSEETMNEEERYCPLCDKRETRSQCSYGEKAWDKVSVKDEEYSMARGELETISNAVKRLQAKVSKGEGDLEAWVQSKITKAADYIDTAADYLESGESEVTENLVNKIVDEVINEKCWPGYKKKGMKTMFGKRYPNCVKAEDVTIQDADGKTFAEVVDVIKPEPIKGFKSQIEEATRLQPQTGNVVMVTISWRGKYYAMKMFFPQVKLPTRKDINDELQKVYPGSSVVHHVVSEIQPGQPLVQPIGPQGGSFASPGPSKKYVKPYGEQVEYEEIEEDWQSVNRKDKTAGLSRAAVAAYRRENPGSKLQTAVTEKNPSGKRAERRKSFCRRMKGMKSKLTSAKTARDPDSNINKALRRWNCN